MTALPIGSAALCNHFCVHFSPAKDNRSPGNNRAIDLQYNRKGVRWSDTLVSTSQYSLSVLHTPWTHILGPGAFSYSLGWWFLCQFIISTFLPLKILAILILTCQILIFLVAQKTLCHFESLKLRVLAALVTSEITHNRLTIHFQLAKTCTNDPGLIKANKKLGYSYFSSCKAISKMRNVQVLSQTAWLCICLTKHSYGD